jgi:hypothetical protein
MNEVISKKLLKDFPQNLLTQITKDLQIDNNFKKVEELRDIIHNSGVTWMRLEKEHLVKYCENHGVALNPNWTKEMLYKRIRLFENTKVFPSKEQLHIFDYFF